MRKITKILLSVIVLIVLFCFGILIADKLSLRMQIVRLHVIANSDSREDQAEKLAVRDAVMSQLRTQLNGESDVTAVKEILKQNLQNINTVANRTLSEMGSRNIATVTFALETFDVRDYETFSLPAGVYESLEISIGMGRGRNWWCVIFPDLCAPTSEAFEVTAVSGGMDRGLARALSDDTRYEFRFFMLDCIGKIENFLFLS